MKTIETVLDLLKRSQSLRDNDNRLIANVWGLEVKKLGYASLDKMLAVDFLQLVAEGKLSSAPTIKRLRAKLQQENEHLRGEKYKFKQAHAQKDWRNEMRKKNIYTFEDKNDWEIDIKLNNE